MGEVGNMSNVSAIPPVIDVVTGTDWPAIITAIVTGLAAVAGIGGTAYLARRASNDAKKNLQVASDDAKANRDASSTDLQVSLKAAADQLGTSINAEDKRAHIAEKRRVYASTVAAMNEGMIAATVYRVACMGSDDEERRAAGSRDRQTTEGMFRAMGELFLMASRPVVSDAVVLQDALLDFKNATNDGQPFGNLGSQAVNVALDALVRSMREDLEVPE